METTRPPGFPGNPPARMPRAPTPARSPPPRPLRCGETAFRPTHDVGPHKQCMSGLNHAAYGLPVNASRPGSPQAHASLGSGWRPTLAGWDWIPTGFRTRFQRSHHGILSPLTGLSRHTRCCTVRNRVGEVASGVCGPARCVPRVVPDVGCRAAVVVGSAVRSVRQTRTPVGLEFVTRPPLEAGPCPGSGRSNAHG